MRVFELLARRGDSQELASFAAAFEQALRAYQERDWPLALRRFEAFVEAYPDDPAGRIYVERCRLLIENPPGEAWDGVYSFASKEGDAEA